MLSFTHNSGPNRKHHIIEQTDFQPIIIGGHNSNQRQKPLPHPQQNSKKIIKAHSNYKQAGINKIKQNKELKPKVKNVAHKNEWDTHYQHNKPGVFNRQMKRDTLAAQQRRQRAQSAKLKKQLTSHGRQVISKDSQIYNKKIEAYEQQKDRQIMQLKALIQKQRKQKDKNDEIYQQKKRQIQRQRRQLQQLQKRIQKQGPKYKKQHKQRLRQMQPELYPGSDRAKCHQDIKNISQKGTAYPQITQSQSIANQRNKLRQQQLQYLIDQRDKNHMQYQRNTLGYTPTLIPLLSRASYKIISTHVSSLVQMFVDDLLEEQVLLLQAIELEEAKQHETAKEKEVINDYIHNLGTFVDEVDQISAKVGRYNSLQLQELHKPTRRELSPSRSGFTYHSDSLVPLYYSLNLTLSNETLEQLEQRVKRYHRFVQNFGEYKPEQLRAMSQVTQQLIDQAITKIAAEIDNGAGQFVNIVFRGQFQ